MGSMGGLGGVDAGLDMVIIQDLLSYMHTIIFFTSSVLFSIVTTRQFIWRLIANIDVSTQ